jgi:N-acetylmuramic acid 6-phosphate etherase
LNHFFQGLLIGEMTGGDRALISSLEGLEDLQVVGKLQLQDHDIKKGDVVFAVTEGTIFYYRQV